MDLSWTTFVGLAAGIFTTGSVVPQVMKTIKTRHTKDISLLMYIFLSTGIFLWFLYGILLRDMPIMLANGIALVLTLTVLGMKVRYG